MKRRWGTMLVLLPGLILAGSLSSAVAAPTLPKPPSHGAKVTSDGPPAGAIPTLESTYVPIKPCRAADTRSSSAGKFRHSTVRPFYIRGTAGFVGQGGTNGGCGVPASATGVTVNTTVTNVTGSGFMTNYPAGSAVPLSNFVYYNKKVTGTSNPTFALAGGGSEPSVQIKASGGSDADLIIDITGYYQPQIEALVSPGGTIYSGSPRVVSVTKLSTGYFQVQIDSNVTYCSAHVTTFYADYYSSASTLSGQNVYVHTWYLNSSSHVETPVDDYFYLTVAC